MKVQIVIGQRGTLVPKTFGVKPASPIVTERVKLHAIFSLCKRCPKTPEVFQGGCYVAYRDW